MEYHPPRTFLCLTGCIVLWFCSYVRVLQADLASLESITILGIIYGAAEVIERKEHRLLGEVFVPLVVNE